MKKLLTLFAVLAASAFFVSCEEDKPVEEEYYLIVYEYEEPYYY